MNYPDAFEGRSAHILRNVFKPILRTDIVGSSGKCSDVMGWRACERLCGHTLLLVRYFDASIDATKLGVIRDTHDIEGASGQSLILACRSRSWARACRLDRASLRSRPRACNSPAECNLAASRRPSLPLMFPVLSTVSSRPIGRGEDATVSGAIPGLPQCLTREFVVLLPSRPSTLDGATSSDIAPAGRLVWVLNRRGTGEQIVSRKVKGA